MLKSSGNKRGFTLIELLVVITIIAILAVAVFIALKPAQRFQDSRNARRWEDASTILNAIHSCIIDNDGIYSDCLEDAYDVGTTYEIVATGTSTGCNTDRCSAEVAATGDCYDLLGGTSDKMPAYMKDLPVDPQEDTAGHTAYALNIDANDLVTITACNAEDTTIQVAR